MDVYCPTTKISRRLDGCWEPGEWVQGPNNPTAIKECREINYLQSPFFEIRDPNAAIHERLVPPRLQCVSEGFGPALAFLALVGQQEDLGVRTPRRAVRSGAEPGGRHHRHQQLQSRNVEVDFQLHWKRAIASILLTCSLKSGINPICRSLYPTSKSK